MGVSLNAKGMNRQIPWAWFVLISLLLLLPGPAGRFLLDLLGGLTVVLLLTPLVLVAVGWVAWQIMRRRLSTCPSCGFISLSQSTCPVCGAGIHDQPQQGSFRPSDSMDNEQVDASVMTIDVQVVTNDGLEKDPD
jgi:hypothetical protein